MCSSDREHRYASGIHFALQSCTPSRWRHRHCNSFTIDHFIIARASIDRIRLPLAGAPLPCPSSTPTQTPGHGHPPHTRLGSASIGNPCIGGPTQHAHPPRVLHALGAPRALRCRRRAPRAMLRHDSHLCSIWMLLVRYSSSATRTHAMHRVPRSEDNCRDERGQVDLELERMVMQEIGLNVLLDYCWNGALQSVTRRLHKPPQRCRARHCFLQRALHGLQTPWQPFKTSHATSTCCSVRCHQYSTAIHQHHAQTLAACRLRR